jgi:hypothetical protein
MVKIRSWTLRTHGSGEYRLQPSQSGLSLAYNIQGLQQQLQRRLETEYLSPRDRERNYFADMLLVEKVLRTKKAI